MRDDALTQAQWQTWWRARWLPGPQTCLDATGGSIQPLLGLASAWLARAGRGQRLHLIWLTERLVPRDTHASDGPLTWAAPPPIPGLHSQVLANGAMTLTVCIGPLPRLLDELVVRADRVLVNDLAWPVDHLLKVDGQVLRVPDGASRGRAPMLASDPVAEGWLGSAHASESPTALVVGGGIAGMTTAACLARNGCAVTVLDSGHPHAGHLAAALTPVVSSDDNCRSRLSRAGALAADRFWRSLDPSVGKPCGALQLARPVGAKRSVDLSAVADGLGMPAWARSVSAVQASELAGLRLPRGGLWLPGGWLVRVPKLLSVLANQPGVRCMPANVSHLQQQGGQWVAMDQQGACLARADAAVLANATDSVALMARSGLPVQGTRLSGLHALAGEITALPAATIGGGPQCVVGGDGYVLPAVEGWCVSGGTYQRNALTPECTAGGQTQNVARAEQLLGQAGLAGRLPLAPLPGWAGWRAVLPGRLPAIGPVASQPGLWVFTGGASRGLTWSVLGAHLVAAGLSGAPIPLEKSLLRAIWPGF